MSTARAATRLSSLSTPDLLSMQDLSPAEVGAILNLAALVKARPARFRHALEGKQMVLMFEKPSLRTRLTFEAGMGALGGRSLFVDQTGSRIGARESLADVAHNLERWVDVIVLRTFEHKTVVDMAGYAAIPVINGLSELEHPCQALADYLTLQENFDPYSTIVMCFASFWVCTSVNNSIISSSVPKPPGNTTRAFDR